MAQFDNIGSTFNEKYRGILLGLCTKCNSTPKVVNRRGITLEFKVVCTRCTNETLIYTDMHSAMTAWNSKNSIPLSEELKRLKEGR